MYSKMMKLILVSHKTYETCFVPEGTKLAARLARCLFVKTSCFNEKQYEIVGATLVVARVQAQANAR